MLARGPLNKMNISSRCKGKWNSLKVMILITIEVLALWVEGISARGARSSLRLRLMVPRYVLVNQSVQLRCDYDLKDYALYTMKMYKGAQEFYRYTPKENPKQKIFRIMGLNIDLGKSDAKNVTLGKVGFSMSAKYTCEVSTDAPDFITDVDTSTMDVIKLPRQAPVITPRKTAYSIGETIDLTCLLQGSKPGANLTWFINKKPADLLSLDSTGPHGIKYTEPDDTETARLKLKFTVTHNHLIDGKLLVRCTGKIYDMYWKYDEMTISMATRPSLSFNRSSSPSSLAPVSQFERHILILNNICSIFFTQYVHLYSWFLIAGAPISSFHTFTIDFHL